MPALLTDIVAEVLAASFAVERVEAPGALRVAVEGSSADVVIAAAERAGFAEVEELLLSRPRTRLFAIAADGRTTALWRLRPERVELGELSPAELAEAIGRE